MNKVKILDGKQYIDDRGSVRFVNDFDFGGVKRFYQVENHQAGFVRAWHGHKKESKYVYVSRGTVLLGLVDMSTELVEKYVLSCEQPRVLYVPPGFYNGFKTLTNDTIVIFYSTSSLDESHGDDYRMPFDKWDIWAECYR